MTNPTQTTISEAAIEAAVSSSAEWDRVLHTVRPELLIPYLRTQSSDDHRYRLAQALWRLGPEHDEEALNVLEGVSFSAGLRLAITWEHLGAHSAVEEGFEPERGGERAAEDACFGFNAMFHACERLQDYDQADNHLSTAVAFATHTGMVFRLENLQAEHLRLQNLLGKPDIEGIVRLLDNPAMPKGRANWGFAIMAQAYMVRGEYSRAYQFLVDVGRKESHVATFLRALLDIPGPPPSDEAAAKDDNPLLARAVMALRGGARYLDMREVVKAPHDDYARIFRAMALVRSGEHAARGAQLLLEHMPSRPDQLALAHVTLLGALLEGVSLQTPIKHLRGVSKALQALAQRGSPRDVVRLMVALAPEWVYLASLMPGAHISLSEVPALVPRLAGSQLLWRGTRYDLPGRVGRTIVMREGFGRDDEVPTATEMKRFLARLAEIGVLPVPEAVLDELDGEPLFESKALRQRLYEAWREGLVMPANLGRVLPALRLLAREERKVLDSLVGGKARREWAAFLPPVPPEQREDVNALLGRLLGRMSQSATGGTEARLEAFNNAYEEVWNLLTKDVRDLIELDPAPLRIDIN